MLTFMARMLRCAVLLLLLLLGADAVDLYKVSSLANYVSPGTFYGLHWERFTRFEAGISFLFPDFTEMFEVADCLVQMHTPPWSSFVFVLCE